MKGRGNLVKGRGDEEDGSKNVECSALFFPRLLQSCAWLKKGTYCRSEAPFICKCGFMFIIFKYVLDYEPVYNKTIIIGV